MAESKADDASAGTAPLVTSEERTIANAATEEFDKGNFDASMKLLKQLSDKRGPEPHVMLNMAVINFYRSKQTNTEEFRKHLYEAASRAQVTVHNIAALDDVDQCVFYYNHAVLLFHQRQFGSALAVLERLVQFVEPLEERLSRRVQLLLLHVYLATQQPQKALSMVAFIDKAGQGKNGGADKEASEQSGKEEKSGSGSSLDGGDDTWKLRICLYKARCYMMLRAMKSYKREVKTLMGLSPNSMPTCFFKSNFEYLRGNHRKAIKLLQQLPLPGRPTAETGESVTVMYSNNLACIHLAMHKPALACFYLSKAVAENENVTKQFYKDSGSSNLSGRPLPTLGISRHYELLYNQGLALLHCGKAPAAFAALTQLLHVFRRNPRLWLRVAECCIMVYKKDNDADRELSQRLAVVRGSVGSGVHRKLLLGPGLRKEPGSTIPASSPAPTLEFASLCLKNALMLLPDDPLDVPNPAGDEDQRSTADIPLLAAPPGAPLRLPEVSALRCSILLSSSYVALCLNDYILANTYATKLLKQTRISPLQRYVGQLYLAEALVGVDKIADAIGHLNPEAVTDISALPPEGRHDVAEKLEKGGEREGDNMAGDGRGALSSWAPRDVGRARAIMQYNLATAHAIRGEFEKALMHLSKSTKSIGLPLPAQMYFLKIYLELMEGRRKIAQNIIREHFGHITPNRL